MADDYLANTLTTGTLTTGGQTSGVHEVARDTDWFKIKLTAGKIYKFEMAIAGAAGSTHSLSLYDSQGTYVYSESTSSGLVIDFSFKASVTGDFYVATQTWNSLGNFMPRSYTLQASAGEMDDIGDTPAEARALTLGQKTSAVLQGSGDIDYFRVSAQAGITYTVTPVWKPEGNTNDSGSVDVQDASGTSVNPYLMNGLTSFTATRTGDYYFAVRNYFGEVINYDLTVSKAIDDHAANKAGAGMVTVGAAATAGSLEVPGDRDWYGVQLSAGTTYWFTMGTGTEGIGYSGGALMKIIAEDGTVMAASPSTYVASDNSLLLAYTPAAAGTYYLEVSSSFYDTGTYQVNAVVGEKDDYGDTQAAAAAIAVGSPVQGKLAIPQDIDIFKLSVTAGKTYLVALTEQNLVNGAALSLSGEPAASGKASMAEYPKTGTQEYRVLTAETTGDYYFTVSNSASRGTGTYALSVTEPLIDDYTAGWTTSGTLPIGGKISGTLDYTGDIDAFKVKLQYGIKYVFQLRGAGSGEGSVTLSNVQLKITYPNQGESTSMPDAKDGNYAFTPTGSGDYYISVSPHDYFYGVSPDLTGSYTLHAVANNGDITGPALVSHAPATHVAPLDNITLRFDEAIMRGSIYSNESITLRDSMGVKLETYDRGDSRVTILGDTLTINPTLQLKLGSQYLLSVPTGAVTDLAGNEMAHHELLSIETLRTVATGGSGNDYLLGLGLGTRLSGGSGVDTVIYGYSRSSYDVGRTTAGVTVTEKSSGKYADVLDGVERLLFTDTSVALDIDGVAGQAYRLYQAAFDRTPDSTGIGFWMKHMDNGMSLVDVARDFVKSDEFAKLYGAAPGDSTFVTNLYQNVLHRAPDQAGFDFWVDGLAHGADRAVVLRDFSESPENHAATLKVIGNGFEYSPYG